MLQHPAIEKLLEPATSEKVLTLPAHLFFIEHVEIPAELEQAELNEFAELTIESISPFPLEHIYWGYLFSQASSCILLYAAHRERVKQAAPEPAEAYAWVVPEFAPLASADFPAKTEVLLPSSTGVCLLHFDKGNTVPSYIDAAACTPGQEEETICALRDQAPEPGTDAVQLRLRPTTTTLGEDNQPVFNFETSPEDAANKRLCPGFALLWPADVRDPAYKKAERNARRISHLSISTLGWAALAALLLLIGEMTLLGGHGWLGSQQARATRQQPLVDTISEQQSLMHKLEQIERNDLRPIAILEALNNIRPKGIYFTKTIVEGENTVLIDGVSNNISALNGYTAALQKSGSFELLKDPKSITRQGKTTFTLQLGYTPAGQDSPAANAGKPTNGDA